jgi:cyclophilin family peptidyl-prolyl cis-trans isomerase
MSPNSQVDKRYGTFHHDVSLRSEWASLGGLPQCRKKGVEKMGSKGKWMTGWFSITMVAVAILCFVGVQAATGQESKDPSGKQPAAAEEKAKSGKSDRPRVAIKTSMGEIVLELDRKKAPLTVENFLQYAKDGFYSGTLFHRVIPGFMVQGGGMEPGMKKKPTRSPIKNEATNGLKNKTGTIAMARTSVVDSATAQFFINCADNSFLDHRDTSTRGYGYAVFGKVVEGMDVVRKIEKTPTGTKGPHRDVPVEDVLILSVEIRKP